MNLDQAPNDVLLEIFYNAKPEELNKLCQSSKRMQQLCNNEQLWKNKYINEFGQPKRIIKSWKKAYINKSFYPIKSVYLLVAYYPQEEKEKSIVAMKGTQEDILNKLASILNGQSKGTPEIYEILKQTYDLYLEGINKYFAANGYAVETVKDCYAQRVNPTINCSAGEYLAELPITGKELGEILTFMWTIHDGYAGQFRKTDRYLSLHRLDLYQIEPDL